MKTITLYELLGLIKKNKFRDFILEKREDKKQGGIFNYFDEDNMRLFSDGYDFLESLDEKAEILEEPVELPNEYKIPKMESADNERILQAEIKINEIISYLKAKKKRKEKY